MGHTAQQTNLIERTMQAGPVIPVLVIERVADAIPMAHALLAGGVSVLEVTLRTPCALDAIRVLAQEVPQAIVAAGTVTTPEQWEAAAQAGAQLAISPGLSPRLLNALRHAPPCPLLPGVATASELMSAMDEGLSHFKFFPAQQAGGIGMLKAFWGPLPQARFCPTGGITANNAADYLALPNVVCVGGSWLAPAHLVENAAWSDITALAQSASTIRQG